MEKTTISLATASKNITASQVQGDPHPQGPGIGPVPGIAAVAAVVVPGSNIQGPSIAASSRSDLLNTDANQHNLAAAALPLTSDASASSTKLSIGTYDETTTQHSRSRTMQAISKAARSSKVSSRPTTTTDGSDQQESNSEATLAYRTSTSIQISNMNTPPGPTLGTPTSKPQNILPSALTLSKGSGPTLDSGTPTTVLAPHAFVTQPFIASDSLLSHTTTMPTLSKEPSFLTISGHTVAADSLGQNSIDRQRLTKGSLITVSGTTISLAPNESDIFMGTSSEAFGPSVTAKLGSGSNGTAVQRYSGNALGARDGLWSSSMMFLVFFVVLAWL